MLSKPIGAALADIHHFKNKGLYFIKKREDRIFDGMHTFTIIIMIPNTV